MIPDTIKKVALRATMRARRRELTPSERADASRAVCGNLIRDARIADVLSRSVDGAVAVYLASPEEIDLSEFISAMLERAVTVVSPRWNGETYELAEVKSLSPGDLRQGPMHIAEPASARIVEPQRICVWIVPGLAFSEDGRRVGYGGGWYDRLLAAAPDGALKLGVGHGFQITADIPAEPHDIALDGIVTPDLRLPQT